MTPQTPVAQTLYAHLLEVASVLAPPSTSKVSTAAPSSTTPTAMPTGTGRLAPRWQTQAAVPLGRDTPETHALVECLKTRKAEAITALSRRPARVSTGLVDGALPNWPVQRILRASIRC